MPLRYSHASETRHLCNVCSEAVTNPLCPSCLKTEIEAWLTLYPDLGNKLLPRLTEYIRRIEDESIDSTRCIICSEKQTAVCPYCFTEYILKELRKIK